MRYRLNAVDVAERARRSRFRAQRRNVIQSPGHVTRTTNTNEARALRQQLVQRVVVEFKGLGVKWQPFHFEFEIPSYEDPRPYVGIVIHARQDDFVPGAKQPSYRSGNVQRNRRHVLAEDDFFT